MAEYYVTPQRMRELAHPRDGGAFTAVAECPQCQAWEVHPIREPSPEPPPVLSGLALQLRRMQAQVLEGGPVGRYGRWDERGFEVVRTCVACGHEWGQK